MGGPEWRDKLLEPTRLFDEWILYIGFNRSQI